MDEVGESFDDDRAELYEKTLKYGCLNTSRQHSFIKSEWLFFFICDTRLRCYQSFSNFLDSWFRISVSILLG